MLFIIIQKWSIYQSRFIFIFFYLDYWFLLILIEEYTVIVYSWKRKIERIIVCLLIFSIWRLRILKNMRRPPMYWFFKIRLKGNRKRSVLLKLFMTPISIRISSRFIIRKTSMIKLSYLKDLKSILLSHQ